jgi:D-serine deaminase-like pyridoxal phosphate-dependent protein
MFGPSIDCPGAKIASDALDRNQTSAQGVCDRRSVPLSPMERGETYASPQEQELIKHHVPGS